MLVLTVYLRNIQIAQLVKRTIKNLIIINIKKQIFYLFFRKQIINQKNIRKNISIKIVQTHEMKINIICIFFGITVMNNVSKEKLEEIYKVYDEKRNGMIKTEEITKLIRSARLFPSEQDIIYLQKSVDPNRQGYFSINKFVEVGLQFADKQSRINHEDQLIKAFSFFDEDESGYITESDLKKIMSAFGQPLNEEQSREIMKYAKSVNGKIYYRDFAKTIISGKLES